VALYKNLAKYGANNTLKPPPIKQDRDLFENKHCQNKTETQKLAIIKIIILSKIGEVKKIKNRYF